MAHWNSSPHPISDIRDWQEAGRLELRPDFQRREVWSLSAKVMLIDTILKEIPIPKIFLANSIRDGRTYRIVIDGQQRMSAMLAFMRNEFALEAPFDGPERGKTWNQLSPDLQARFLRYSIDFNEAIEPTEKEVREVYSRVNKYTVALNKQELRRADFPGAFLQFCEKLALDPRFEEYKIFTPADRRRYADVEYISELVAGMLLGAQDGKSSLDNIYRDRTDWSEEARAHTDGEINKALLEIDDIFQGDVSLARTRFRQKADFYSLFLTVLGYVREGKTAIGRNLAALREDIEMLDANIRPESRISLCREYAIKCVSQANSASSRKWRIRFMTAILDGTYLRQVPGPISAELFYSLEDDIRHADDDVCEPFDPECGQCLEELGRGDAVLAWSSESCFQISNASWVHRSCVSEADWVVLEKPESDGPIFFDPQQQDTYELLAPIMTSSGQQVQLTEWKGRGGNAAVYSCVDASTGEELAIKFLMRANVKSEQRFDREILLMKGLQSEHAIRYKGEGTVRTKELRRYSKRTREVEFRFILMELAEYDLSQMMQLRTEALTFEQYAGQFRGLAGALAELHERAIHRDIKPENILIIGDRWILSDYGLCTFVDEDEVDLTQAGEIVGPKYWFSPEAANRRIKCDDEITRASDVYQLAAIFWYAVTGRHPSGIVTKNDWVGSQALFDLLSEALKHDQHMRPKDGGAMLAALVEALQN